MKPYEVTGFVEHSHTVGVDASDEESAVREAVGLINHLGARVHQGTLHTESGSIPFYIYYAEDEQSFDVDLIVRKEPEA